MLFWLAFFAQTRMPMNLFVLILSKNILIGLMKKSTNQKWKFPFRPRPTHCFEQGKDIYLVILHSRALHFSAVQWFKNFSMMNVLRKIWVFLSNWNINFTIAWWNFFKIHTQNGKEGSGRRTLDPQSHSQMLYHYSKSASY